MNAVYIASRVKHGEKLKAIAQTWDSLCVSRWLSMVEFEIEASPADFTWCWLIDENDIKDCSFLVVYAEPEDILSGALVEVGMALAYKKVVIVVGSCQNYGTWRNHPQVLQVDTLDQARRIIEEWRIESV